MQRRPRRELVQARGPWDARPAGWDLRRPGHGPLLSAQSSVLLGQQLVSGKLSPPQVLQVEPMTSRNTRPRSR